MLPPTDEQGRFLPNLRTGSMIKRFFAKLLDAIICGLTTGGLSLVMPLPWASFIGVSWFVLTDWSGSPGKWLFQLRAVTLDGKPLGPLASIQRNLLLGLPTFLRALMTSGLIGLEGDLAKWDRAAMACISLTFIFGELIGMLLQPENRRWGDTFARSRVVDR
jgi:uncharacterized RDD family membrane protein YckC